MALWTMTDEENGKPKYLNDALKAITVGVDATEAVDPDSISRGLTTPGWNTYMTYTDSSGAVRHKAETLIVSRSFNSDGNDTLSDDLGLGSLLLDYPIPGSGAWMIAQDALNGQSYHEYDVTTVVNGLTAAQIQNRRAGLARSKYDGNFTADASDTVESYNDLYFGSNLPLLRTIADTSVGWGQQLDGEGQGEHNFSVEWKGYIRLNDGNAPSKWTFFVESDDCCALWIGDEAYEDFSVANCLATAANNQTEASRTLLLDNTKYYPIRIMFSEFGGGCKFQMYAINENGLKYGTEEMSFAFNEANNGFN